MNSWVYDNHQEKIIQYYTKTQRDYRLFWDFRSNRALHLGYHEERKGHISSLEAMNRVLAEKTGISPGDMILDAGCGYGNSALWLAEQYDNIKVKGISIVPHQINQAQRTAKKRSIDKMLQFEIGDYCRTNFPDQYFSVVWACESLCHAKNKFQFYKEAFRILQPGGRIIIAEPVRVKRNNNVEDEKLLNKFFKGFHLPDLDTPKEHIEHISKAGFAHIKTEDVTNHVLPSLKRMFTISRSFYPVGKLLWHAKILNAYNYHQLVASVIQYKAIREKLLAYTIISALKPL